jgi:hypothetical protein
MPMSRVFDEIIMIREMHAWTWHVVKYQWYSCECNGIRAVERSYTISNIDKTCSSMGSKAPRHASQGRRMVVDMRIRSVNSWGPS